MSLTDKLSDPLRIQVDNIEQQIIESQSDKEEETKIVEMLSNQK